jgi:eukaryotic-like serine/threonine-protein kinase
VLTSRIVLTPGAIIADRFEIERRVQEGGMGVVYRAIDRTSGHPVALKLMLPRDGGGPGFDDRDERFAREIRLLAQIEHPRIARYVGHGSHADGRAFLAMQWLDGLDLGAALVRGPLSPADALRVLAGAAEAVAAVHARGIVHRDLKPSNLFLRGGSTADVVLLDFGVSRRLEVTTPLTGTAMVGTPHYMAPEQITSSRDIRPSADVFSLGCVFYECLTGRRPFDASQLYGVLARILYDEPDPLPPLDPPLGAAWSDLLGRMLDKRALGRPQDGAALVRALAALPPAAPSPPSGALTPAPFAASASASTSASAAARGEAARTTTSSDQVLVCVVLATVPGATLDSSDGPDPFDSIRSAMHRFGCLIERLPDGSLLATVLPRPSATDLVNIAARCAMYLREQLPQARIAVATGRAPLGKSWRIGETVDRAARLLEGAAASGEDGIRLDAVTRGLLDARFITASHAGLHLLRGESPDLDSGRPLLGKPTPCVGRELELIQLEGVASSAIDERVPKAAVVLGPPGIGKSRLRHELLRRLQQRHPDASVLVGYGDPISAGSPHVVLADALRRRAGIRVGAEPERARVQILDELGKHVDPAHRRRVAEFLGELVGVPFPAEASPPLLAARGDHRVMSEQIALAFSDWLAAECAVHPVVLVLEDLQWGDALTVKVLEGALRDLERGGALFILVLGRPETADIFPRLLGEHRTLSLSLRPLSDKASELLVRATFGEDIASGAVARIVRLAAGNALFLEELIRAAAEGDAGDVPETVLAMLQARLSGLEPEARLLLRAACILGETFWRGGVRRVREAWNPGGSGADADTDADAWLGYLVEQELVTRLRTSRFPGDVEYAFRHALVCDAARGLLTDADQRTGHLACGRWLEEMGEGDAVVLARHAELGGDVERAIGFYARAAEQSLGQHDFIEALVRATKGIALGASGERLGVLRAVKASAHFSKGQWSEAADAGLSALALVPHGGALWCAVVEGLMQVLPNVGEFVRCEVLCDELLTIVPAPEVRTAYVRAVALQLLGYAISGAYARGQACLAFIDNLAIADDEILGRGYARLYRAIFTFILGRDIPAALALSEQAARDLDASRVTYRLSLAYTIRSFIWWGLGDHEQSERAARQARLTALEVRDDYHAALSDWYLGLALSEQDDPVKLDEAEHCAETMVQLERGAIFLGAARVISARVALAKRDWARAEEEGRLARAALVGLLPFGLMASAYLFTALLRQDRAEEAAGLAREDLARLEREAVPVCSEVLFFVAAADALLAAGDRPAGEAALRRALHLIDLRAAAITDPGQMRSFAAREENRRASELARQWLAAAPA